MHKLLTRVLTSFETVLSSLVWVFTYSYDGPLHNYTLEPIKRILDHQKDPTQLRSLLVSFRSNKLREISFVQKAATLAAGAVIGAKSWPDTPTSYWLAPMFWNISLWCSTTSLISSALQRLLERLPDSQANANRLGEQEVLRLLGLVLRPVGGCALSAVEQDHVERGVRQAQHDMRFETHHSLLWVWQCPTMLMSYAWVFFLAGFELYVLSPLIRLDVWNTDGYGALISSVFGVLICANFLFTSKIAKRVIELLSDEVH